MGTCSKCYRRLDKCICPKHKRPVLSVNDELLKLVELGKEHNLTNAALWLESMLALVDQGVKR